MEKTEIDTREGYDLWSETYDSNGNPLVAMAKREPGVSLDTLALRVPIK